MHINSKLLWLFTLEEGTGKLMKQPLSETSLVTVQREKRKMARRASACKTHVTSIHILLAKASAIAQRRVAHICEQQPIYPLLPIA